MMKVSDVMTPNVESCSPDTPLYGVAFRISYPSEPSS
jgi:CBS domain-containing protein